MTQIVLVHGAWHGAWCWDGVLAQLRDRDIDAVAVELPFTGFADDVDVVRSAIASAGQGVVVCAHSYGGAVVSQAVTQSSNVGHLVYLAAFVNAGDASALTDRPISLLEAIVTTGEQCSFDPGFARSIFYGDSEPETIAALARRLRPMVLDAAAIVATPPAPRTVPSTYVVCSRDGAIPPEAQYQMAQELDRVVVWPTDHSPFLTRPGDVADLLERTIDRASPEGAPH
jgi:pimeloyl-ACP methyl ester carboxylesterase